MFGQDPGSLPVSLPVANPAQARDFVDALQHLGWIDVTALTVLGVFCILGLFKGIVWQISRVVILAAAYTASARLGQPLGGVLLQWTHSGPTPPSEDQQLTAFYIGCMLVFVGVLIVLSLLSLLVQKLVKKAGLGFYDRLFGGVLGVGSGAIVVLFLLTAVYMFKPDSGIAEAASTSHSLRLSQKAVDMLGEIVPEPLRRVFPKESPDGGAAQGGAGVMPAEASGSHAGQPSEGTTKGR